MAEGKLLQRFLIHKTRVQMFAMQYHSDVFLVLNKYSSFKRCQNIINAKFSTSVRIAGMRHRIFILRTE